MRRQDVIAVLLIVFLVGVLSFFISSAFISPSDKKLSTEVVAPITSDFPIPSSDVFNAEAVNPAVRIEIAPSNNNQPFAE